MFCIYESFHESFHKSFHESFHKSFFELFFSASMKKRLQRLKEPTTAYPTSTYILRLFLSDMKCFIKKTNTYWGKNKDHYYNGRGRGGRGRGRRGLGRLFFALGDMVGW